MEKTALKLEYCSADAQQFRLPVIIVAAGSSSRMNGENKQLMCLNGIPVIIRTLRAFQESPFILRIILVVRESDLLAIEALCEQYSLNKLTDILSGGSNRHESVLCGMGRLRPDEKKVLIHDGARPLVSNFVIGNVVAAMQQCDAAVCAVKINDTVKRADSVGNVATTVDRAGLYAAQTPQGVHVGKYLQACENAGDTDFTDDASVMEKAGIPVKIVTGSVKNIKITAPVDFALAGLYLEEKSL